LLRQLRRHAIIPLRQLDLQPQHIRLQLQDLILDLPNLQTRSGFGFCSACGGDGVVETAGFDFGVFSDLGGTADDLEIIC
jgi:hypothetical protein